MTSLELRAQHDSFGNAPHLLAEADVLKIERGEWFRAGHETECETCNRPYWRHPEVVGALWLHRLCDGELVKL